MMEGWVNPRIVNSYLLFLGQPTDSAARVQLRLGPIQYNIRLIK